MNIEISKHYKDLIQKHTSGLFRDTTLEFYGIKTAKIKELISADLPVMELSGSSGDIVFLLEDASYLHFEFQSTYNKNDLERFAFYDLRLYQRDGRKVTTVIIYTSDVKDAPAGLDIGSLEYYPQKVMMAGYNGNDIFNKLNDKIKAGDELTEPDMVNLIFLPMMKSDLPRNELAVSSINMAQSITDKTKRDACILAAIAFAKKYLLEDEMDKLLREALKMTDVIVDFLEREVEKGVKKGIAMEVEKEVGKALSDKSIEIAKKLLKHGTTSVEDIAEATGLDEETVRRLQAEMSGK